MFFTGSISYVFSLNVRLEQIQRDRSWVATYVNDWRKLAMLQTPSHNRHKHLFTLNAAL